MELICPECGVVELLTAEKWCCSCGGAWEPAERSDFDLALIDGADNSVWRYRRLFAVGLEDPAVRLGAGGTPLLHADLNGVEVWLKLEYMAPTASFKDRGSAVMINLLAKHCVTHIADDSSGNAGASVAAYAARAGIKADIFVPAHASATKQAQIAVFGAQVRPVPGPRPNAKIAALEAAKQGIILASHAYHPGFLLGQQTVGWELWEQLGRKVPDWYVVPVGQGVHLLGVWLAFRRLREAGLAKGLPRLVAVQSKLMAPLCQAFHAGLEVVPAMTPSTPSMAEGLAIDQPIRGMRLLEALRETQGLCLTVGEEDIQRAQGLLARQGFHVEPSSATAVAALPALLDLVLPGDVVVVPLTGSGLKGTPALR
jgi:threonine synthase